MLANASHEARPLSRIRLGVSSSSDDPHARLRYPPAIVAARDDSAAPLRRARERGKLCCGVGIKIKAPVRVWRLDS
jgi:hypothetical protein